MAPISQGHVAFVTGANGVTGNALVEFLIRQPSTEWSKIIITSRSPLLARWQDPRVKFFALDFLEPVESLIEQMAESCKDVTHAFFTSYVHSNDFKELATLNTPLFDNFLNSIDQVAGSNLQRIVLQTGGKNYGVHLGPTSTPMRESLPRYDDKGENFYFPQEDALFKLRKQRQWGWNVIRPNAIIGCTPGKNGMSEALSLALYLIMCKETGETPAFFGTQFAYNCPDDNSYAESIADLSIWAATHEHAKDEAFNHQNGDVFVWRYFLPALGEYFGIKISDNLEMNLKLEDWAQGKEPVWQAICEKYGGNKDAFNWATWGLLDWLGRREWCTVSCMSKAREYGWTRYDDTLETWLKTFKALENEGVLPRLDKPKHGGGK